MGKDIKKYVQAWELRQKGLKLREIGKIMGFSAERARYLVWWVNSWIRTRPSRLPKGLKNLMKKYYYKSH